MSTVAQALNEANFRRLINDVSTNSWDNSDLFLAEITNQELSDLRDVCEQELERRKDE